MKVFRFATIAVSLLISVITFAGGLLARNNEPASSADWPMQRHDSRNTAFSDVSINPPFRLAWRVRACANPSDVLLASGGAVCVANQPVNTTFPSRVVLFDSAGRLLWKIEGAIPVYLKGQRVIVAAQKPGTDTTDLVCYDWKTKRAEWTSPLGGRLEFVFCGAVENGGRLYCSFTCNPGGGVACPPLKVFDTATGKIIADGKGEGWSVGPPACDDEHVFFGISHTTTVLDAKTLAPSMEYYDGGNAYLILNGSMLIAKGWDAEINSWDLSTRKPIWLHFGPRDMRHCLASSADGQKLLIESSSATVLPSGNRLWNAPLYGTDAIGTRNFVYMAGGLDVWASRAGGFYGIESASGKIKWKYERPGLKGISIIASEGSLYATGNDGYLYRFDPQK